MVSPYEVLQVDPGADDEAIQAAYRERVKETHPDQGGSASEFRLVQLAYEEIQERRSGAPRADRSWREDGPRRARDGPGDGPAGRGGDREPAVDARVEYLNYEALEDHGWTLSDDDLFEKAAAADLDPADYGRFAVEPDQYLLEAAEERGFDWPFSCRGGACANCAVAVCEGDVEMAVDTVLTDEQLDRGIRLSCIGSPVTDRLRVVYNVKQLPGLEELQLPPRPFGGAAGDD